MEALKWNLAEFGAWQARGDDVLSKETSAEVVALAARMARMNDKRMISEIMLSVESRTAFFKNVRSVAASALAQFEKEAQFAAAAPVVEAPPQTVLSDIAFWSPPDVTVVDHASAAAVHPSDGNTPFFAPPPRSEGEAAPPPRTIGRVMEDYDAPEHDWDSLGRKSEPKP